jgi:hypothetical protein
VTVDELFDAWEAAWSGRDPAAFAALSTPDLHYEDPLTPEPLHGAGALGEHAQRLWQAFPDVRVQRSGDRVLTPPYAVAPVKLLGTHSEPLGPLPATHRFITTHALVYAETQDGLLHMVRAFYDVYGVGVQLGALPRHGTFGEKALLTLRGFGLRAATRP